MTDAGKRRPTRGSSTDLAFILMTGMLAVPLLAVAIYVLFLDLEAEMKAVVAASALICCAPLVAVIIYVLIRPLAEVHSTSD